PEAVMPRAQELAARLAKNGPLALRKIKEAVLRTSGEPLARAYEIENEGSAAVMASKDAREGPRAFMGKRGPGFTGEGRGCAPRGQRAGAARAPRLPTRCARPRRAARATAARSRARRRRRRGSRGRSPRRRGRS